MNFYFYQSIANPREQRTTTMQHRTPVGGATAVAAASRGMTGRAGRGRAQATGSVHVPVAGVPLLRGGGAGRESTGPLEVMFVARSIAADHKDLIHDVSFDFHGRRMATCSSDQSVKVRAEPSGGADPEAGEWERARSGGTGTLKGYHF